MTLSIRFILGLFIIINSTGLFAQKVEIEAVSGPALVAFRDSDSKLRITPRLGVGLNYHITNHWSATTQFLYELRGTKLKGESRFSNGVDPLLSLSNKFKSVSNLNYLTLPVMMRYSFGAKVVWWAGAGGYISYLMRAKNHTTFYGNPGYPDQKSDGDMKEYYKDIDAGLCIALGMTIPVTKQFHIKGYINESLGLLNISKSNTSSKSLTNSLSLQLGVGYLLMKNK